MKLLPYLFLMFWATTLFCQQTKPEIVSTAGNHYSNSNASLSWTIGEPVTETTGNGNNILTQGFHQSNYIISVIDNILPEYSLSVYPNPTTDFISIQTEVDETLTCGIFNSNGQQIFSENITKHKKINLQKYPDAHYILTVYNNKNQLIKSFNIIKQ